MKSLDTNVDWQKMSKGKRQKLQVDMKAEFRRIARRLIEIFIDEELNKEEAEIVMTFVQDQFTECQKHTSVEQLTKKLLETDG